MKYKTTAEMAALWHINQRTVRNFCAIGKIPGVIYSGKQWMIPNDSKLPIDGRTKLAKTDKDVYTIYHFPIFIFSPLYASPEELNEEERALLKAQKLHFEGKFVESIALCRDILSTNIPTYLIVGAYATIAYSTILLGLYQEYKKNIELIENIVENENEHKEDFRLILYAIRFITEWDSNILSKIDQNKLSYESLCFFKYNLITASIFPNELDSAYTLYCCEADIREYELMGLDLARYNFCLLLAIKYHKIGNADKRDEYVKTAVDIVVENGWIPKLSKYCGFIPTSIENYIKQKGTKYYLELKQARDQNVRNWSIVKQVDLGGFTPAKFSNRQVELAILCSYKLSYKDMAKLLNTSSTKIKNEIDELLTMLKMKDKKELIPLIQNPFKTIKQK